MNVKRIAIVGLYFIIVSALFVVAALRWSSSTTAKHIQEVVAAERGWRIDQTPQTEVEVLKQQFSANKPTWCQPCDFDVELRPWFPDWMLQRNWIRRGLSSLGIRPFLFRAGFRNDSGRFSSLFNRYYIGLSDGSNRAFGLDYTSSPDARRNPMRSHYFVVKPVATALGGGEALQIKYDKQISESDWQRALEFNFNCLTAAQECEHLGEYQPSAWADYVKNKPQ